MPLGSIIGGLVGSSGANAAAGQYGQAAGNADFIRRLNEAKLSPWFQSGQDASNVMSGLLGLGHYVPDGQGYGGLKLDASNWQGDQANALAKFQPSPDYQFRMKEGVNALDRSAASRGMLLSGAQTKGVQQYGGNLASGEYNNWYNKLAGLSGAGLSASGTGVQSNLAATGMENSALAGRAGAYQQSANALAGGISGAVNSLGSLLGYGLGGGFDGGVFGRGSTIYSGTGLPGPLGSY